jgi:WD40 repeat protein
MQGLLSLTLCLIVPLLWAVAAHGQAQPCRSLSNGGISSSGAQVIADTARIFHEHNNIVRFADYSPDGSMVITGDLRTTIVWNPTTGADVCHCYDGVQITSVAFRPDSRSILVTDRRGSIVVSDLSLSTTKLVTLAPKSSYFDARYSPDGSIAATAHADSVVLWNPSDWSMMRTIQVYNGAVVHVRFSPDGRRLVTIGGDSIRVWDVATGHNLFRYPVPKGRRTFGANFSSDGTRLVLAGDTTSSVIDVETGELRLDLRGHTDIVNDAAYSIDGKYIVTAGADKVARIWNAQTGEPLQTLVGHTSMLLVALFSPDGKHILTAGADSTVRIWGVSNSSTGVPLEVIGDAHLAISPNIVRDRADIIYVIDKAGSIGLELYDMLGNKVLDVFDGLAQSGTFTIPLHTEA